jgi:hypothetical protein
MSTRRVLFTLSLALTFACAPLFARVEGNRGRAPDLPDRTPGIDRPFPQDDDKFTFAIIGDKTGGGQRNWPIFDRAMDEVSRLHPDFAIMVGDLIQGNRTDMGIVAAQWDEFNGHAERMEVPFFFLPGNHDILSSAMYDYWEENVGRTYYSFSYAGCRFVLLNTEEGWRAEGGTTFGPEQMAWLEADIAENRDAKHTFVFLHKPVWNYSGKPYEEWEQVEGWLDGLDYTVFAGHYHRLSYETRQDRPYYVLSATGAGLGPSQVREYGSFHHYTTVTVDGDDVHIAIIEPGNIHPHDIAPREFREQANRALAFAPALAIEPNASSAVTRAVLTNTLDATMEAHIAFDVPADSSWEITPVEVRLRARAGETADQTFDFFYDFAEFAPLPTYRYTLKYAGTTIFERSGSVSPKLSSIPAWTLAGGDGIGADIDLEDDGVEWVEATTDKNSRIDLTKHFDGENQTAYARVFVYSPNARDVVAAARSGGALRVLVGDAEAGSDVGSSADPTYVSLPLEAGWNRVLVESRSHEGGWGFALHISDVDGKLKFSAQPQE